MRLFLSIEGWSQNVIPLLKQSGEKNIILMHGYELHQVLDGQVDLEELLNAKAGHLRFFAEPH